ncbi:MAG: hypothetical protein M3Q69_10385 [Acidobacteriota bacterium]|nr:hypothetical protein [Acidobacteriota bacterium]
MTVSVYMFGLICHVNKNDDSKAKECHFGAVVNAPAHRALLISRDSQATPQPTPLTKDVFFQGLSAGPARATGDFHTYVPHLRDNHLTKGKLKNGVKNSSDKQNVHAYIHYPVGSFLHAVLLYRERAEYFDRQNVLVHHQCAARLTRLDIPGTQVEIPNYGVSITVDEPILIVNADFSAAATATHSRHYEKLLDDVVADARNASNSTCPETLAPVPTWIVTQLGRIDAESTNAARRSGVNIDATFHPETVRVECGNTQWP